MEQTSYEFAYWLRIESEPEKEEEKILNLIKTLGGEIIEKTIPKKRQLSYPIDKQHLGYFGMLSFLANPETIIDLKKELIPFKNILRFMIIKNKPPVQEGGTEAQKLELVQESAESNVGLLFSGF